MADTYWDHPARRETKRLLDLADVGAILDELQQGSTEWDDAREALDHLVRGPRAEVERLRAERTRAVDALSDVGRTAEATSGDLEDGINTELLALSITVDVAEAAVKRAQDPDLIRRAIADPGAYVKRKRLDNGEPAETVPAWGARAVIAALRGTEAGR